MLAVPVAAARPEVGIPLGVLIGIITAIVFLYLLYTAFKRRLSFRNTLTVAGQVLALPTFWFGGPWLATQIMASVDIASIVVSYINSLCITFILIIFYPICRLIVRVGNSLGKGT